ncbi:MAG TPA: aldehyde dehydrogenase family protein [Candidatus Acidoferrum sp.]|nr:aldehyde dehydrogenase family protein [Candidatus Acidoferrum sp.]
MPAAIESINLGFLLDGQWRNEGERIEIFSPGTRQRVGVTYRATSADAEAAIRAATRAFEVTRRMGGYERQRILRAISSGIEKHSEELARIVALEAGKPIKTACIEVDRAVFTFSVAAEEAVRVGGEYLPLDWQASTAGRWGIVRRFPLGPIAAITPFNFPINLVAHKIAPAIAAGCTIVLKPAPQTPLTALRLAQIIEQAGWPAGALNALPLSNDDAAILVSDDRLKLLSFTGSTAVGWALKQKAGKKRVVLELGGNAGVVICADATLEYAADRCVIGGYSYAGQSCISVQRILVEENAYEKFLSALVSRVQKLKVGNVLEESTDVGPLISEEAARRVIEWIEEAVRGGAKIVCGGHRNGAMVTPTILTNTKPDMRVNCMEIFGPVVTVEKFSDYEESLNTLNRSEFGLQAGVFTRDFKRITRAFETLEVGGLMIGEVPTFRIDHMPYGGAKDSGLGREGLRYAIEEMTEPRLLAVNPAGL